MVEPGSGRSGEAGRNGSVGLLGRIGRIGSGRHSGQVLVRKVFARAEMVSHRAPSPLKLLVSLLQLKDTILTRAYSWPYKDVPCSFILSIETSSMFQVLVGETLSTSGITLP